MCGDKKQVAKLKPNFGTEPQFFSSYIPPNTDYWKIDLQVQCTISAGVQAGVNISNKINKSKSNKRKNYILNFETQSLFLGPVSIMSEN